MGLMREIRKMARNVVRTFLAEFVETHMICQVISFDDDTGFVNLQPCIERFRTLDPNNMQTVKMPPINNVPVQFYGSGDLLTNLAPKAGSYGSLHVSKRRLDGWLSKGGVVTPTSSIMFDQSWGFFAPGIYHLVLDGNNGKLQSPILTDRIGFRNRAMTKEITLDEDGVVRLVSDEDFAIQYTAMKAAFDTLKTDLNALVTAYNAHIHVTTATIGVGPAVGVISPTVTQGTASAADMSSAKIEEILVP